MAEKKEMVTLVDKSDNIIGYEDKGKAHDGRGKLHRAFSVFIFNGNGEMLIQKRAEGKRLWPGYWANACCSHPKEGEGYAEAAEKRLKDELGFTTRLRPLFKFQYRAAYGDRGSESEMDQVFSGTYDGKVDANPGEVAEWKFVDVTELQKDVKRNPDKYAPWFREALGKVISHVWMRQNL
ncbi:MAG: isopentenyl-diphosphate Delta-isomerase [Candidatus Diapherotrites archaeon]